MRWLAGLVVVLAAIAGALYGVGYFLLPNGLEVTRSIQIERPRSTIFAQINDLRIVKEWSPFYARDPAAEYTFSAETPGEGQNMRWKGADRQVGDGELTIIRSTPPHSVETVLRLSNRAALNADMQLQPQEREEGYLTQVVWRVSAGCQEGAVNIPCRYMNLLLQRMIERDLDSGLARLKAMSEQQLDVDFEGLAPDFETLTSQPYLYIPVTVRRAQAPEPAEADAALTPEQQMAKRVDEAMDQGRRRAEDALMQNSLARAGPLVRVLTQFDDERMAFRIGYPFSGPSPLTLTGEEIGETPAGRVMRVVHDGPRAEVQGTYARAFAFLRAHHIDLRGTGLPWEVVLQDSREPNGRVRIAIYYPIQ